MGNTMFPTHDGERESKGGNYIAVSEHLYNDSQYKSVLKAGENTTP